MTLPTRHPVATVLASLLLCAASLSAQARPNAIDTMALRAHARFLAHDSLAGRANGSRGQQIAADYIIGELRRLGLEPLGANGDYRQPVPLTRVTLPQADAQFLLGHARGGHSFPPDYFHYLGGDSVSFRPFYGRGIHVAPMP